MSDKKLPAIPEDRQSQLKLLIARGKEQGYLTYAEVNDHLPPEIVDPEQIEDIVNTINDMGITVYEKAPDAESLLLTAHFVYQVTQLLHSKTTSGTPVATRASAHRRRAGRYLSSVLEGARRLAPRAATRGPNYISGD